MLFLRFKRFIIFIKSFLVLIIGIGLSGCAPQSDVNPTAKVCTPQAPNVNIYRNAPRSWSSGIFQYAATPLPPNTTPQDQQILDAKFASFEHLISESKQWSAVQTIKLDNSSEAQIIVTFISPELIEAVYLSEILENRLFFSDFQTRTQAALDSIAIRDELIFFIAVTTTNNNNINLASHLIDIPIKKLALINTEDLLVSPGHDDHILDQPINSSFEPVYGYLSYPFAIMNGIDCSWLLDPTYNKSITITVPEILVDGIKNGPYTWVIPYSPLLRSNLPPPPPMFLMPPQFDQTLMSPMQTPPGPILNLTTPYGLDQNTYWRNYARFLWNQITLGEY